MSQETPENSQCPAVSDRGDAPDAPAVPAEPPSAPPPGDNLRTVARAGLRLAAIREEGRKRRTRRMVATAEWIAAAILIAIGLYFLWFLVFPSGEPGGAAAEYTREDFRARLRALPAIPADPAWKARETSPRWRRIVIHHTATDSGTVEAFDRNHREERKWENGLGYHFVIGNGNGMDDGEVAAGRRWLEQIDGAHVVGEKEKRLNETSIGIALVGNFEKDIPSAGQLAALKGLLDFLRRECHIGLASIVGHRDLSSTACPGANIYMDEILLVLANP
ncbi:MAG: peptidoglycan recognition protein family protein [Planctomycetota bacterium]|nr:peptidoglycan recognition protein family protein [Planctomycetota bacterium]